MIPLLSITEFLKKVYLEDMSNSVIYEYVKEKTNNFEEKELCTFIDETSDYCNNNLLFEVTINKHYISRSNTFKFPDEDYAGCHKHEFTISSYFRYLKNKHGILLDEKQKDGKIITSDDMFDFEFWTSQEKDIETCKSINIKIKKISATNEIVFKKNYKCLVKLSDLLLYEYEIAKSDFFCIEDTVQAIPIDINFDNIYPTKDECEGIDVSVNQLNDDLNTHNKLQNLKTAKSFEEIFRVDNWEKYVDVLTECKPPLLEKEANTYKFIGNIKTQRGCVAQWFKHLKDKSIIDCSINRNELAEVLTYNIQDYSINGTSICNTSSSYKNKFEQQLLSLIKLSPANQGGSNTNKKELAC